MSRQPKIWFNFRKNSWCTDLGGKRRTLAKGKSNKQHARDEFNRLIKERELLATVNGAVSVAKLCELFLADTELNLEPRTYESYQYGCQKFVDQFGLRNAHSIEPLDIQRFSEKLKLDLSDTSRAIVLRSVQRCFNWGVQARVIPAHNLGRIRKPKAARRDRYLTDGEFQTLLRGTNPKNGHKQGAIFRRILLALDWTCCRPGELARLQWTHVFFHNDVAILPDHKTKRTGKPKIIPLVPKMKRLLGWLKSRSNSEFCFVNSKGDPWKIDAIEKRMAKIKERSGLKDVIPYTIRHRAATNSIIRTGDLKMTSLLLGHTSTATTERYTHLAQEHLVNFAKKAIGSR